MNPRTKRFRGISVLAIATAGAFAVSGCASATSAESSDSNQAEGGSYNIGVVAAPPYLLYDEKENQYFGSAITLVNAIAAELGKEPVQHEITFATMIPSLETKQIDIIALPLFDTPERAEVIDVIPWDNAGSCYLVKASNDAIAVPEDLNSPDITVALAAGQGPATLFPEKYPKTNVVQVQTTGTTFPIEELLSGRADAVVFDNLTAKSLLEAYPDLKVVPELEECLLEPDLATPLGLGIRKDDPNRSLIEGVIKKMHDQLIQERNEHLTQ